MPEPKQQEGLTRTVQAPLAQMAAIAANLKELGYGG